MGEGGPSGCNAFAAGLSAVQTPAAAACVLSAQSLACCAARGVHPSPAPHNGPRPIAPLQEQLVAERHEALHAFHHHLKHSGPRHTGHGGAGIIWLLILLHVAFIGYWGERPLRPLLARWPRCSSRPPTFCASYSQAVPTGGEGGDTRCTVVLLPRTGMHSAPAAGPASVGRVAQSPSGHAALRLCAALRVPRRAAWIWWRQRRQREASGRKQSVPQKVGQLVTWTLNLVAWHSGGLVTRPSFVPIQLPRPPWPAQPYPSGDPPLFPPPHPLAGELRVRLERHATAARPPAGCQGGPALRPSGAQLAPPVPRHTLPFATPPPPHTHTPLPPCMGRLLSRFPCTGPQPVTPRSNACATSLLSSVRGMCTLHPS